MEDVFAQRIEFGLYLVESRLLTGGHDVELAFLGLGRCAAQRASIMPAPRLARSAPIWRVEGGMEVPKSISTAPGLIPARIPLSP